MSTMTTTSEQPSVSVTKRSERHEATVRADVSGMPDLPFRDKKNQQNALEPSIVKLMYTRHSDRWHVAATVYGLPKRGSRLLNVWTNLYGDDEWPAWLRDLAESEQP